MPLKKHPQENSGISKSFINRNLRSKPLMKLCLSITNKDTFNGISIEIDGDILHKFQDNCLDIEEKFFLYFPNKKGIYYK